MPNKGFHFGDVCSLNYGVKLLEVHEERYAARDYNAQEIKGRSGDFISDNDRLKNITLVMTCAIVEGAEPNIYGLNAALLSLSGYQRLEYTNDAEHYRMAAFKGGIKPRIAKGEDFTVFELEFDCKPQRFLKAGERTALTLSSNVTPKSFYKEGIANQILSSQFLSNAVAYDVAEPYLILNLEQALAGADDLTLKLWYSDAILGRTLAFGETWGDPTIEGQSPSSSGLVGGGYMRNTFVQCEAESRSSYYDDYALIPLPLRWEIEHNGTLLDEQFGESDQIYNPTKFAAHPLIRIRQTNAVNGEQVALINGYPIRVKSWDNYNIIPWTGGQHLDDYYIDCETMNAYKIVDYAIINCNPYVILPTEQITLKSGVNEIYVNGYIDSLEIIPRWWTT